MNAIVNRKQGVRWELGLFATVQLVVTMAVVNHPASFALGAEQVVRSVQETKGRWLDELDLPR